MTKDSIINTVLLLPIIKSMGEVTVDDKREALEALFESVKSDILISYDWPFAIKESTKNSVVDQASYQLKGDDNDCRQIVNVRYGSSEILLNKRRQVDMDEYMDGRTISTELFWLDDGFFDGYPKIKIVDTPDAVEVIKYRYRAKDVPISVFPSQFEQAFIHGMSSSIEPSFLPLYKKAIDRLIDNYGYGGGEDDPIKLDPLVQYRNNRRSTKFGYGG